MNWMRNFLADTNGGVGAVGGAAIGAFIGLLLVFILTPSVLSNRQTVLSDDNATSQDKTFINLLSIAWFLVPVITSFGGGYAGSKY